LCASPYGTRTITAEFITPRWSALSMSEAERLSQRIHNALDVDEDGDIDADDLQSFSDNLQRDSIDKELDKIRQRRLGGDKRFPKTFDDLVLIFGVIAGITFFGGVMLMSSGALAGDSIFIDESLSQTPLDTGGACVDREGEIWFNIWNSHDEIFIQTHNVEPKIGSVLLITMIHSDNSTIAGTTIFKGGIGDLRASFKLGDSIPDGDYILVSNVFQSADENKLIVEDEDDYAEIRDNVSVVSSKQVNVVVSTHKSGGPLSSEMTKEAEIHDSDQRSCWTVEGLGNWGWVLMGAEWIGGRETAMLTGGSAGIPAWWMALISLGMSIFFLCVQYPLMHRMYHRDQGDLLTESQFKRLITRILKQTQDELRILIQFDQLKMQERAISIDIFIPYHTTSTTVGAAIDIRGRITKDILEEFTIFGEMRPLQIKTVCTDGFHDNFRGELILDSDLTIIGSERLAITEDYSPFFAGLRANGRMEEAAIDSMSRWFKKHDLVDYGTAIIADEEAILVRVIYRPVKRFTYFRFSKSFIDMEMDLESHLLRHLGEILDGRELIVSARNEKATLSDRAVAGRVEQGSDEYSGQALVARQGGITGALLQNPFMGDILSSVEYVAHKNRSRIDKYGFWGLIVFVWIPFMASGVLVGAMLGLVARMRFRRVLFACLVGGTAASVTWAYTARNIIEFMERYHAEFFIPFIILLAFVFTFLHLRRNKRLRREELFRESIAFFSRAGIN